MLVVGSSSAPRRDTEVKANSCCQSCKRRPTPFPTPWKSLSEPEPQTAAAQSGGGGGYTTKGRRRRRNGRRRRKRRKVLSNSEKQSLRAVRTGWQPRLLEGHTLAGCC